MPLMSHSEIRMFESNSHRENQIHAMQRTVDWFDRYLKNKQ
jgi:hypothetical protein